LFDSALQALSEFELIDATKRVNLRSLGFGTYVDDGPGVALTVKGKAIYEMIGEGTLEAALNERNSQLLRERERHKRCIESTDLQRIEFEDQFLLALYITTAGDTRAVELGDVWSRLSHECASELTTHAVNVWRERKCIEIRDPALIFEGSDIRLTAFGRDLCRRAMKLGSVQEALSERMEGHSVKNEYNFQTANVVGTDAHVHDNEFAQFVNATGQVQLDELAQELAALRNELKKRATSPEHDIAIGEVSAAEVSAREGDRQAVWQHLAKVGKWVLDTANQIGVSVAAGAITTILKYYNIPIS
jgi:hypothetical protein